jgi:NAD(P)-dependent dehydrogenase (short-subunit alcohol dehydrogenase family)
MIAGGTGHLAMPSYGASKAALIQMAKYLAIELGPQNILTNVIAPGFYPTKMSTILSDKVGGPDVLATMIPNRRVGTPNDIASLVVFLSSKAGSYVNGATVVTDGGFGLLHSVNAGDASQDGTFLG